jgi:hypothetical protein
MKKIYLVLLVVILANFSGHAQTGNGAIKVTLKDKSNNEAIPFANVVAYKDGVQISGATTNMDGEAFIKPLSPGKYTVKGIFVGYQAAEIKDVLVGEGKTAYVNLMLANGDGVKLDEVVVTEYIVPLIDPNGTSGATITREDYQNLAVKDINSAIATSAGVFQADEGRALNVGGGRDVNTTYFVDGVKVFGTPKLPQQSIEQLSVLTGGIPANFGDLTAGAISISTRGPQSKTFGGIELISSQLTDKFGYNSLGFSVGGPIYKKKDSTRRTVLGYFISGQGNYVKEPFPSFVPIYVLNDDKLAELKANPLQRSPSGTGFIRSSEFVTKDDMRTQRFRPNAVARLLALNGKIDFAPTPNTNITLGGNLELSDAFNAGLGNQIFNSENNSKITDRSYRGTLSITQKFGNANTDKNKTQSLLSNSFFKFLASYEYSTSVNESARHRKNLFDYAYIGKFDRNFLDENWAYNYDFVQDYQLNGQAINTYTYRGRTEIPLVYTPGTQNPDAAAYTNYLVDNSNPNFLSINYIQGNNGLVNGSSPQSIYSQYSNFGTVPFVRTFQNLNQFRIATSFNTDIKSHAISVGLEFDQRTSSFYLINGGALWTRMRQITNQHNTQLDLSNPIKNEELSGLIPYYYFNYLYEQNKQTQFSEQLLDKLGLPRNYTGFVNTDALDPSQLDVTMFSAEDLLGQLDNNNLVNYRGYTHDGKRDKSKMDINNFLTKKDANGRNTLPIGSFKPIYSSVYIMDKFDFKDIKLLVGLRVDRYDANQQVLKDKYALHELAKVSDLNSLPNLPAGFSENIPSNMSKDAAVYVATDPTGGKSPGSIRGYRLGDKWFNSEGNEISDPNLIASTNSRPIPLFKDNANYDKNMSIGAFSNYVAAINAMPRIAFSFPISDLSNFVAHYDILTQRPTQNALNPLDYYFLNAGSTTPLLTNPDQKPQQTVDYELGYEQVLNERKNAVLKIRSFYKEFRNQINQKTIVGAYPRNYIIYDNIDFGTVKGLTFEFDLRRTGGSRLNVNYTLQFAEGSGSNANSGANLASTGQPNLRILQPLDFDQRHTFVVNYDYRFGVKKDYKGPSWKNKKQKTINFLENAGFNLSFLLGSGTPYTRWNTAVPINGGARSNIVGQINGSSKPWTFRTNLRIDKTFTLKYGKGESEDKKETDLNVYVQVLNLLNNRNVLGVYNFTGSPDDDGYLSSTQAQAALALANSAASFRDLYTIRMNVPGNYSLPRQIRLGVLYTF